MGPKVYSSEICFIYRNSDNSIAMNFVVENNYIQKLFDLLFTIGLVRGLVFRTLFKKI